MDVLVTCSFYWLLHWRFAFATSTPTREPTYIDILSSNDINRNANCRIELCIRSMSNLTLGVSYVEEPLKTLRHTVHRWKWCKLSSNELIATGKRTICFSIVQWFS